MGLIGLFIGKKMLDFMIKVIWELALPDEVKQQVVDALKKHMGDK